jgi:predicted ATP-grasp superfamily ATP-dependent carboligase
VLWGNSESVIRNVRNPLTLAEALQSTRLPVLDVRSSEHPPEADGTWLLKPTAGVGGRGIALWTPDAADHPTLREPHYFQRRVEGECCSAVFVGRENPGDVEFVGISRQLVGWEAMHAPPFTWCGSIGPVMKSIPCEHKIRRIGNVLMWKFRLRGLFGVDFIIDQEETPWVTEVNPRYPASTEIFELACGFTLLRAHASAFGMRWETDAERFEIAGQGMVGKGVLFAERDFTMPEIESNRVAQPFKSLGRIADVSPPGTMIHKGQPVCSLLVEADSSETAMERLQAAASEFEAELLAASRTSPDSNEASVS